MQVKAVMAKGLIWKKCFNAGSEQRRLLGSPVAVVQSPIADKFLPYTNLNQSIDLQVSMKFLTPLTGWRI